MTRIALIAALAISAAAPAFADFSNETGEDLFSSFANLRANSEVSTVVSTRGAADESREGLTVPFIISDSWDD